MHNAHAPIVIKLDCFLQPFVCRRLAYLMLVVGIYNFLCIELPGWNQTLDQLLNCSLTSAYNSGSVSLKINYGKSNTIQLKNSKYREIYERESAHLKIIAASELTLRS